MAGKYPIARRWFLYLILIALILTGSHLVLSSKASAKSSFIGIQRLKGSKIVAKHYKKFYLSQNEEKTFTFKVPSEGEYALAIYVKPYNVSWCNLGDNISAELEVSSPGLNQRVVLFNGSKPTVYRIAIGKLMPPRVTLTLKVTKAPDRVKFYGIALEKLPSDDAFKYSPVIAYRDGYLSTDTPLLMYYEEHTESKTVKRIDYYVIFSNEDGGTPTDKLIALWGHFTDIEWVASVWVSSRSQEPLKIEYQAVGHKVKEFNGKYVAGYHPLLKVASLNNNFSDEVASLSVPMIAMYPVPKLEDGTREEMQDRYPWIYEVTACELYRESKLEPKPNPDTLAPSDPSNYLFIDVKATQVDCGGLIGGVQLKDGKWYFSSHGIQNLAIPYRGPKVGDGWIRFAVEVPPNTTLKDLKAISIKYIYFVCPPKKEPLAIIAKVKKIMKLTSQYKPEEIMLNLSPSVKLTPDKPEYILDLKK